MTNDVRRTMTEEISSDSLAWQVNNLEQQVPLLNELLFEYRERLSQQQHAIAKLERENEALWAFVKATDAIGTAMTANDREAALDAAKAATEARAALRNLRGDR